MQCARSSRQAGRQASATVAPRRPARGRGRHGSKPVERQTASYQAGAQIAVVRRAARLASAACARRRRCCGARTARAGGPRDRCRKSSASITSGALAAAGVQQLVVERRLLQQADVGGRDGGARLQVRPDASADRRISSTLVSALTHLERHAGQVLRHALLVPIRRPRAPVPGASRDAPSVSRGAPSPSRSGWSTPSPRGRRRTTARRSPLQSGRFSQARISAVLMLGQAMASPTPGKPERQRNDRAALRHTSAATSFAVQSLQSAATYRSPAARRRRHRAPIERTGAEPA